MLRLVAAIALTISVLVNPARPLQAAPIPTSSLAALPFVSQLFTGQRPANLGIKEGKLAPCPQSPNCVVSQGSTDAEHTIAPLAYQGDRGSAWLRLVGIVKAQPRTAIIEQTDTYLYTEFTSQWMGYVDDVEFYLDPTEKVIHVRSASRLGESDLGVNRNRIEAIRQEFSA